METQRLSETDLSKVKAFLAKQKFLPVQQSWEWGEFQKTLGNEVFRVGIEENGELAAYAQIFVKKLPLGFTKIEVPRLLCGKHEMILLDEIRKIGEENSTIFIRFELQKGFKTESSEFHITKEENFPLSTLILDLTKSEEEILAQMKPKGRYNIRVAEKHSVEIQESRDIGEFYGLLCKTTARDGFASHPQSYYEELLKTLRENAQLLVAKKDEKAIAGILITFSGDTCTYYYGASDHDFRQFMAPYLLQWRAIQLAKKRGVKFYDFLGIAPESSPKHHLAGVTDFKKKFGGEVVNYPQPRELVLNPVAHKLLKLVKRFR